MKRLTEPYGDRIKGSKKKPENIKFPPYAKKPQAHKKEDCKEEEENVGEEGDSASTSTTSSTTSKPVTSTTTTSKPPVVVESAGDEAVAVSSSGESDSDESSVAEAKPGNYSHFLTVTCHKTCFFIVGLAIAGEGGVASSKPVATAVVGPGGLAVGKITNQILKTVKKI